MSHPAPSDRENSGCDANQYKHTISRKGQPFTRDDGDSFLVVSATHNEPSSFSVRLSDGAANVMDLSQSFSSEHTDGEHTDGEWTKVESQSLKEEDEPERSLWDIVNVDPQANELEFSVWTTIDEAQLTRDELETSVWTTVDHLQPYEWFQGYQDLTAYVTQIARETGLDAQDYKCAACKRPLGIIFGEGRICHFDGKSYCDDCHHGNQAVLPGRVLHNWEFKKYQVCSRCYGFLNSILHAPILDVRALYNYVPVLEEMLNLRTQMKTVLQHLSKCAVTSDRSQLKKKLMFLQLYEKKHNYTLNDLCKIHNGVLPKMLMKILQAVNNHINKCMSCSSKGQ